MISFTGAIFGGEIDPQSESIYVTQVKSMKTGSNLSLSQVQSLYKYVLQQEDTCMLTINDHIPILLEKQEVSRLIADLEHILQSLKEGKELL